jgi:hypothetical protein
MSQRITKGHVQSILNAFGNAGRVILLRGGTAEGAPADFLGSHGAIRPFDDWDNRHFCQEDWHVILIAAFDGGDRSYTRQQFQALADQTTVSIVLDGAPLPGTTRTATRHFEGTLFGFDEAYYFQEGRIMSPDDLSVGEHHLEVTTTENGTVVFQGQITFHIDAAGTGACLG